MTNSQFEHVTTLQYRLKSYSHRLRQFETGEKYVSMKADVKRIIESHGREVKALKSELADANSQIVTVRNIWMQMADDMELAQKKEREENAKALKAMEERALDAERRADVLADQIRDLKKELYEVKVELDDANGRNQKLLAQLNRDYENSSVPSSMKPNRKIIANNREKTGKRPGGQPGHKGHGRKRHEATNHIKIEPPNMYTDSPFFRLTGNTVTKQVVRLCVNVVIDEYSTPEFWDMRTRQRVHAEFPEGVVNEVNYDGSIKSLAFLLNNYCNVSIEKVREIIKEITGGQLEISHGMICGLAKEFSLKTQAEQKEAFAMLQSAPFMCTDFTGVRVNGKNVHIAVCANDEVAMFFARLHKGHKGVAGTPVEDYQGILVHDHDRTFYNYGSNHQECLGHPLRYLKGSMENEPNLTWNKEMRELLREMIHYRNSLEDDSEPIPEEVGAYRARYLGILETAMREYEYEPPSDYYKAGYNLYKRLGEYIDNHLLFLSDHRVPTTNNLSERLLRLLKRKFKQVMTFRSFENLGYICDGMGVIAVLRTQDRNLFSSVSEIFG
jgi:hypothetical protein